MTGVQTCALPIYFYRPAEVDLLLGDPSRAEKELGWERQVDFPGLVKLMVKHDLEREG